MISDDELDRLLYESSPARTPIGAKPDAAAMQMLERIMATDPHPHRVRNRVLGLVSAAAVVIAAVAVGVGVLTPSGKAEAETPEPLSFSGSATVAETISDAQAALSSSPGPEAPLRLVRSATWGFSVEVGSKSSQIVPQFVTLQWEPDQSGRVVIVEGKAYDPTDAAADRSSEVSSSGVVSMDLEMKPGEFTTPLATEPGTTRDDLAAALAAFGVADGSAFGTVQAINDLLSQWTLTNAQQSHLLDILGETEGATALGASTDRLGRSVDGLRVVSSDGAAAVVVLVSRDTGRIVGFERTNLMENDVYPVGAVINYELLDVDDSVADAK